MPVELIEPQQAIEYGGIGLSVALVIFLGLIAYYVLNRGISTMHRKNYISESAQGVLQVLLRWATVIVVVLISLQQIGVQVASVWATLSAVVVLLGVGMVAVWSVASNIFCSLLLLLFRPFSIGDKIELVEATGGSALGGKVVNLNLLYTFLLEENNDEISNNGTGGTILQVPNNIFFQKTIRRWQGEKTRSLDQFIFKNDKQSVQQNVVL